MSFLDPLLGQLAQATPQTRAAANQVRISAAKKAAKTVYYPSGTPAASPVPAAPTTPTLEIQSPVGGLLMSAARTAASSVLGGLVGSTKATPDNTIAGRPVEAPRVRSWLEVVTADGQAYPRYAVVSAHGDFKELGEALDFPAAQIELAVGQAADWGSNYSAVADAESLQKVLVAGTSVLLRCAAVGQRWTSKKTQWANTPASRTYNSSGVPAPAKATGLGGLVAATVSTYADALTSALHQGSPSTDVNAGTEFTLFAGVVVSTQVNSSSRERTLTVLVNHWSALANVGSIAYSNYIMRSSDPSDVTGISLDTSTTTLNAASIIQNTPQAIAFKVQSEKIPRISGASKDQTDQKKGYATVKSLQDEIATQMKVVNDAKVAADTAASDLAAKSKVPSTAPHAAADKAAAQLKANSANLTLAAERLHLEALQAALDGLPTYTNPDVVNDIVVPTMEVILSSIVPLAAQQNDANAALQGFEQATADVVQNIQGFDPRGTSQDRSLRMTGNGPMLQVLDGKTAPAMVDRLYALNPKGGCVGSATQLPVTSEVTTMLSALYESTAQSLLGEAGVARTPPLSALTQTLAKFEIKLLGTPTALVTAPDIVSLQDAQVWRYLSADQIISVTPSSTSTVGNPGGVIIPWSTQSFGSLSGATNKTAPGGGVLPSTSTATPVLGAWVGASDGPILVCDCPPWLYTVENFLFSYADLTPETVLAPGNRIMSYQVLMSAYARVLWMRMRLGSNRATVVTPFRTDIAPGSFIGVEVVNGKVKAQGKTDLGVAGVYRIFGVVANVGFQLSANPPVAQMTFELENVRTSEFPAPSDPTLYPTPPGGTTWSGTPLVATDALDLQPTTILQPPTPNKYAQVVGNFVKSPIA